MPGGDEIRDVQRAAWAGLSAGWEKWDSVIMDQLGPVGTAMIERLDVADDQRHLDIAAGTGEPGLTIARLAPAAHVLTDLSAEMLGIAARRADAQGITNVETRVCAAPTTCPSATRPSTASRYGSGTCSSRRGQGDRRVRAGAQAGRAAVLVGMGQARGKPVDGDRHAGHRGGGAARPGRTGYVPVRRPGISQCQVRGRGFREITEWDVGVELVTRSPAQYWEMISEHVSLAVAALAQVGEPARERIAKAVMNQASAYEHDGRVRIPGMARCVAGTK